MPFCGGDLPRSPIEWRKAGASALDVCGERRPFRRFRTTWIGSLHVSTMPLPFVVFV